MLTYKTADQLIIGLKSLHPIFRIIKESNFPHIILFCDLNPTKIDAKYIKMIEKFINKHHIPYQIVHTDNDHSFHTIDINDGLFISIGKYYIHNIARLSNINNLKHYVIDSSFGKISGYGDNIYWQNGLIKYDESKPTIVFNPCKYIKHFEIDDAIYFLHEIYLALSTFINNIDIDFISTLAINGICGVLKNINIIKTNKLTKHQLSKISIEVAQADALMKYAFNNIGFTHDIKEIADDCHNFDEFMNTLAYRSKHFFNQCIKTNRQNFESACEFNNYSFQKTIDEFNAIYDWFNIHEKQGAK